MSKKRFRDLFNATTEEAVGAVLDSDALPTVVEGIADSVVSEAASEVIGSVLGAVAPRIHGVFINYKMNRFQRMVSKSLKIFEKRMAILEQNYSALNEEMRQKFTGEYLEWLLDNLYDEKQDSKIPFHVNSYINLMTNEASDNMVLAVFNTLNELTQLDIDVLHFYGRDTSETIYSLSKRYGILPEQLDVVKEKLNRLGLLYSRNEEQRDLNLDKIIEYLIEKGKDEVKSKPRGVSVPKIAKVKKSESYSISRLGRSFLHIVEAQDLPIDINATSDN